MTVKITSIPVHINIMLVHTLTTSSSEEDIHSFNAKPRKHSPETKSQRVKVFDDPNAKLGKGREVDVVRWRDKKQKTRKLTELGNIHMMMETTCPNNMADDCSTSEATRENIQ